MLGTMVPERRASLLPGSKTADPINSADQQNTVVNSLPCPTWDWTATQFIETIPHHLPHRVPLSRVTSPDFKIRKGWTFNPDSARSHLPAESALFLRYHWWHKSQPMCFPRPVQPVHNGHKNSPVSTISWPDLQTQRTPLCVRLHHV